MHTGILNSTYCTSVLSVLGPIVLEERVVFGVVANVEKDTSMQQLEKEVAPMDLRGVCVCMCTRVCVDVLW